MRLQELARRKKQQYIYDPYQAAYDSLMYLQERGQKCRPNNTLQLFVPRNIDPYPQTQKDMRNYILKRYGQYAYDDEGNLTSNVKKELEGLPNIIMGEGFKPPILAKVGTRGITAWTNKPAGISLWTSSAIRKPNNTWTSRWNDFEKGTFSHGPDNPPSKIGYLYKVKPNTTVLELDTNGDAKVIYEIFYNLKRNNKALYDEDEWKNQEKFSSLLGGDYISNKLMMKDFPWGEIEKHFDCIHHDGYFNRDINSFLYGWDVESTAWFNPNRLEFLGQVKLWVEENED